MNVVFRVDAALHIGSGHVMRCLTLAQQLLKEHENTRCVFICRDFDGNLAEEIKAQDFEVVLIPVKNQYIPNKNAHSHKDWLGVEQEEDARETVNIIKSLLSENVDWLIVDHYALDHKWQDLVRKTVTKVMVIDDLADRKHNCDILLDQTYNRKVSDYSNLVPAHCDLLLGSHFSLLRSEFLSYRPSSLEKRNHLPKISKILISMGGMDEKNATELVLRSLEKVNYDNYQVIILLGRHAQHIESIRKKIDNFHVKVELNISVNNVAEIMSECDLVIGAGGTTTWERCCLGLPSIVIATAANQILISEVLSKEGAVWYAGLQEEIDENSLSYFINHAFLDKNALYSLTNHSKNICDGKGSKRVANRLMKKNVLFRRAISSDCTMLYEWRNSPVIRQVSVNSDEINFESHCDWFENKINDNKTVILIAIDNDEPVGCIRYDFYQPNDAEVSIYLSPNHLGLGLGLPTLKGANEWLVSNYPDVKVIRAKIKENNIASQHIFKEAGFVATFFDFEYLISKVNEF